MNGLPNNLFVINTTVDLQMWNLLSIKYNKTIVEHIKDRLINKDIQYKSEIVN